MDLSLNAPENPWSSNDVLLGVTLGDPRSGLVVARRCGLLPDRQVGHGPLQSVNHSSSVQMINLLKRITKLNKQLMELEFAVHRQLLDQDSADLVHLDVLEKRMKGINTVLGHFSDVLSHKDYILTRLQSGSTENSLQITVSFHKYVLDILQSINPTLTNLSSNNSHIKQAQNLDVFKSSLEGKMSTAVQSLVECKDMYRRFKTLHNLHHSNH